MSKQIAKYTTDRYCCKAKLNTVETGYKNIIRSRKCSYNRYVLIKRKVNRRTYRNVSSENVLITGMFLYPVCSYNRYVLITGMFLQPVSTIFPI